MRFKSYGRNRGSRRHGRRRGRTGRVKKFYTLPRGGYRL